MSYDVQCTLYSAGEKTVLIQIGITLIEHTQVLKMLPMISRGTVAYVLCCYPAVMVTYS